MMVHSAVKINENYLECTFKKSVNQRREKWCASVNASPWAKVEVFSLRVLKWVPIFFYKQLLCRRDIMTVRFKPSFIHALFYDTRNAPKIMEISEHFYGCHENVAGVILSNSYFITLLYFTSGFICIIFYNTGIHNKILGN